MNLLDLLTIALAVVGCWGLAQARVKARVLGPKPEKAWAWGLVLLAVGLRLVLGGEGLLHNGIVVLRDLGIGTLAGGVWLLIQEAGAKGWLLRGVLAIGLWLGLTYLLAPSVPARFLLELGPDDRIEEVESVLDEAGVRWQRAFPNVTLQEDEDLAQYYEVWCPAETAKELMAKLAADKENVDSVQLNETIQLGPALPAKARAAMAAKGSNDPLLGQQTGFASARGLEALAVLAKAKPKKVATVAICDTGVEGDHEDIESVFSASPGDHDGHGHGTHCAGLAGASTNNAKGMASLNWAGRFVQVKGYAALNERGSGSLESIAQAIIDAAEDGADVISLSLGGYSPKPQKVTLDAVEYATRLGAIVVAAAGNSNEDAAMHSPANVPGVIVVSAVDDSGAKAPFSNTNTSLGRPIAAPGVDVLSLGRGDEYVPMSGTSMATPVVSGLLGVMRALNPKLSAKDAYEILRSTGRAGPNASQVGRTVDLEAAVKAVAR